MLDKHNPSPSPPRGLVSLGGIQFKDRWVLFSLVHKGIHTLRSVCARNPQTGSIWKLRRPSPVWLMQPEAAHLPQTSPSLTLGSPSTGADAGVDQPPAAVTYNCWFSVTNGRFFGLKQLLMFYGSSWDFGVGRRKETTSLTHVLLKGVLEVKRISSHSYIFTPISFLFFIFINFGPLFGLIYLLGSLICESFIYNC